MVPRSPQRHRRQPLPRLARPTRHSPLLVPLLTLPRPDSPCLQNSASTHRNRLFHLLNAAASARAAGTVQATKDKRSRSWDRFILFLQHIGIPNDPFLDHFTRWQRNILISAFAQYLRDKLFDSNAHTQPATTPPATLCQTNEPTLRAGTINGALSDVAQSFRAANRPDPRLDDDLKSCFLLQQQSRGYSNLDPNTTQQKALPIAVLRYMRQHSSSHKGLAMADLCIGAIFFAMRSCEYSKTCSNLESKRTKILCIRNLRFFHHGKEIPHTSPFLEHAEYISITFEFQKNDERSDSVGMHRTTDPVICPVKAWARTTQRILGYPNTTTDSPVNTYRQYASSGSTATLSSTAIRNALRSAVKAIGKDTLGFEPSEIGTHSIRSGAAMAMYLAKVPTYTIMIIGRWSSDAFLRYIRKQVEGFSSNISTLMLDQERFFTTPNVIPTTSSTDTRRANDVSNFATLQNGRRLVNHLGSFAITL